MHAHRADHLDFRDDPAPPAEGDADLVLIFGARERLAQPGLVGELKERYPRAILLGCSTAGEIRGPNVNDGTVSVTAVAFERTRVKGASASIRDARQSRSVGAQLAGSIPHHDLQHAFVVSDGITLNGSELVRGLLDGLPEGVTVTGGLSGDGPDFQRTSVIFNDAPSSGKVAIVGFYGDSLEVGFASMGGWDSFGTERLVTRSEGNVLYELDGKSALQLYKRYLGRHAEGLPGTALLFPLSVRIGSSESGLVRTVLSVSEADQSMTFAGDVPEGSYARLMKANFDRLIDGAMDAAELIRSAQGPQPPELAILISCVGRKMVLKQRVEEEVEVIRDVFGADTALTGFYSYGEISPARVGKPCELHNQTMTITTFRER